MEPAFRYTTQFILDKPYYSECFDQSVSVDPSLKRYSKASIFVGMGTILLLTGANNYASWFIIGLGILEALSVKFKRPWWLLRQMWSRAAGNEVELTIDENGIATKSAYVNAIIAWDDIYRLKETEQGFLFTLERGQSYLSKRYLNQQACEYIRSKN
ncbi:YcxB family protein [Shewanella mesophila]|uniref:YcxB family protein n=1 Tax=Shewanella mesophila TaxID=2864208 RepID=UPI001C655F7D|nr:YcxB family protein [Shewanella mesophila]QYJ85422.1 YcxB family protein [Shewanella mesophila]